MSDSTQTVSATLAAIRARLFGKHAKPGKPPASGVATTYASGSVAADSPSTRIEVGPRRNEAVTADRHDVNGVWSDRWDAAPDDWKRFVANLQKDFGMSPTEEERIRSRKMTYVETPELQPRSRFGTSAIILTVGTISKVFVHYLNTLHSHKMHFLYDAIERRDSSRGLLTFSNHQSVMDDPFLLSSLLPMRILANARAMRWGLCSLDICFQNGWVSRTLRLGKALPIERRGGISQPFLRAAATKLNAGDWVHIFPEGRVRQSGMGYSKRGVGKLLAMTFEKRGVLPLIAPMYHEGIEHIMPQKACSNSLQSIVPKRGRSMFVLMGEPVDVSHIFDRLMPACVASGGTAVDAAPCLTLYEEVADFMAIVMRLLRSEARRYVKAEHDVDLGQPYEFS